MIQMQIRKPTRQLKKRGVLSVTWHAGPYYWSQESSHSLSDRAEGDTGDSVVRWGGSYGFGIEAAWLQIWAVNSLFHLYFLRSFKSFKIIDCSNTFFRTYRNPDLIFRDQKSHFHRSLCIEICLHFLLKLAIWYWRLTVHFFFITCDPNVSIYSLFYWIYM